MNRKNTVYEILLLVLLLLALLWHTSCPIIKHGTTGKWCVIAVIDINVRSMLQMMVPSMMAAMMTMAMMLTVLLATGKAVAATSSTVATIGRSYSLHVLLSLISFLTANVAHKLPQGPSFLIK